jgi:phosphonate ABC transporter permease subunit PhnE
MTTNDKTPRRLDQAIASLFTPGSGQIMAGALSRGLTIFATIAVSSGLTIWTAAQRGRFPDYAFSSRVFLTFLGQTAAIFVFFAALNYLLARYVVKGTAARAFLRVLMGVVSVLAILIVSGQLVSMAIPADMEYEIYGMTSLLATGMIAAIWLWNVTDAVKTTGDSANSLNFLLFAGAFAMLIVGTQITEIDLEKALAELNDEQQQIIISRIFWPWDKAFVYDFDEVDAEALIQAPCPEGSTGPEVNEPSEDEAWIVVTPTCGELSVRDSQTGGISEFGTLLTITGGNFRPNQIAHIQWQNPIGDPFRPRGFGESSFEVSADGTFSTELNIPDVTISSTAQGDQIHTIRVFQQGTRQFTGQISREFRLALEGMLTTIMMGMMATFVGIVLSVPISFLAARNLMRSIRVTLESFVGGIFGVAIGGWIGVQITGWLKTQFTPLANSATLRAVVDVTFVLLFAALLFRILGWLIETFSKKFLPEIASTLIVVLGLGALGAVIGNFLGRGFANGILGLIYVQDVVDTMAPRTALIGAVIVGGWMAYNAYRIGPGKEITVGQFIYAAVRTVLNIFRAIEPLIWAVIGIIWVGPGPFAGFMALTIHTVAALGKLYSEAIESIDPGPIEALQATGANRLQTIVYAVIPQVLPPFISFTIYRWDINVRMSTVIGLVGGGGIGFLLIQWIRQFQYSEAGMAVWLITITVAVLDFVSAEIRERFV